jgi:hypothetical protein
LIVRLGRWKDHARRMAFGIRSKGHRRGESCYDETDEAANKRASLCGAHMDFQHRDLKLVRYTHLVRPAFDAAVRWWVA